MRSSLLRKTKHCRGLHSTTSRLTTYNRGRLHYNFVKNQSTSSQSDLNNNNKTSILDDILISDSAPKEGVLELTNKATSQTNWQEKLDQNDLNKLLSVYKHSDHKKVSKILQAFLQKDVLLGTEDIMSLLQSPVSDNLQQHIKKIFNRYRQKLQPIPTPVTTALMDYFYKHNMKREAFNVSNYSDRRHVPKDGAGWGILCRLYAEEGKTKILRNIISKFISEGPKDDKKKEIFKTPEFLKHSTIACGDCNDSHMLTRLIAARQTLGIRKR